MSAGSNTWFREIRAQRLRDEVGTIHKQSPLPVALVYPSPYAVGMSSLGFQTVYRQINELPGHSAERAFLPDDVADARRRREGLFTYESGRPVSDFPVVAFSVAYELEVAGLVDCLDLAGIPALAADRAAAAHQHPLVVVGGPLTFSNPVPAGPYADVIVMGEAEELVPLLLEVVAGHRDRAELLADLARRPGFYVPDLHGEALPPIAAADDALLPAHSQVRTPHTELSNMFLIEPERGCHRGCTYCVMRRSTNGGMRLVPPEAVLARVPADARRVGLVGAAVTDHPKLPVILRGLVDAGREVGISSLRADRLNDEIVGLLKRGGYRTLTTASDGASERLRGEIQRKTNEKQLLRAAELCRRHELSQLKLYMMVGLPGETEQDIEELARFSRDLAAIAPRLVLGIAPFVSKRNTPLDRQPFTDVRELEARLALLRARVAGRVELRPTPPKWAWIEHRLAQGGFAAGLAAARAARAGRRYGDWRAALAEVPLPEAAPPPPPRAIRPARLTPIAAG
jgi:radical SAM superfamily enzyme YgiQ (UPF0313 family)